MWFPIFSLLLRHRLRMRFLRDARTAVIALPVVGQVLALTSIALSRVAARALGQRQSCIALLRSACETRSRTRGPCDCSIEMQRKALKTFVVTKKPDGPNGQRRGEMEPASSPTLRHAFQVPMRYVMLPIIAQVTPVPSQLCHAERRFSCAAFNLQHLHMLLQDQQHLVLWCAAPYIVLSVLLRLTEANGAWPRSLRRQLARKPLARGDQPPLAAGRLFFSDSRGLHLLVGSSLDPPHQTVVLALHVSLDPAFRFVAHEAGALLAADFCPARDELVTCASEGAIKIWSFVELQNSSPRLQPRLVLADMDRCVTRRNERRTSLPR